MKMIDAFIGRDVVSPALEFEGRIGNAIAESAHDASDVGAIALVVLETIEVEDEVAAHAPHRIGQAPQDGAVGEYFDLQSLLAAERDRLDAATVFEHAERPHHRRASWDFLARPSMSRCATQKRNSRIPTTIRVHHELSVPLKITSVWMMPRMSTPTTVP